jgi:ssDNA-binding Zn-finger/Zn-ribbon topoisomerase 1
MKDINGEGEELDFNKYLKVEKCPKCESKMILKNGKFGKFWLVRIILDVKQQCLFS